MAAIATHLIDGEFDIGIHQGRQAHDDSIGVDETSSNLTMLTLTPQEQRAASVPAKHLQIT
ncbi:unannotated protein [freshwater metagenome]|uniref:Unannotated protein n=1 Tax=freshwater metagenome TaxID=449393 RepID=A0A6J7G5J7_9ZZZZ